MAKKLILIAIIIFGYCILTFHNVSMATSKVPTASDRGDAGVDSQNKACPAYSILTSRYVARSSLTRALNHNNGVRIKILLNGIANTDIEDFSMEYDSGNEYRMGNIYGIENSSLPLYVKITYRSWNTFHAVQSDVTYEFVIYYPGTWDVTICN
jgi:hypothetical protein